MSSPKMSKIERQVLRALRDRESATVAQLTELMPATGASNVVEANASLAKSRLVEPVPGVTGALRLTSEGSKLAETLPEPEADTPGSGGGDSAFN